MSLAESESSVAASRVSDLKAYVKAQKRKRVLADEMKKLEARLDELEPKVLNWFEKQGMTQTKVDGLTVFLRRELWAGQAVETTREGMVEALKAEGLGEYVAPRLNTQSFSAWVRERVAQWRNEHDGADPADPRDALPESIRPVVKVSEVFKLGTRAAK